MDAERSSGCAFSFPPFEGKFSKFQNLEVVSLDKLPSKPDTSKVYTIYGGNKDFLLKDEWNWQRGNKSNKSNFSNEEGISSAKKYKCKHELCGAVKYVDTMISFGVSRVYYEKDHTHGRTSKINQKVVLPESFQSKKFPDVSSASKQPLISNIKSIGKFSAKKRKLADSSSNSEVRNISEDDDDQIFKSPKKRHKKGNHIKTQAISGTIESEENLEDVPSALNQPIISHRVDEGTSVGRRKLEDSIFSSKVIEDSPEEDDETIFKSTQKKRKKAGRVDLDTTVKHQNMENEKESRALLSSLSKSREKLENECIVKEDDVKKLTTTNVDLKLKIKVRNIEIECMLQLKQKLQAELSLRDNQKAKACVEVSNLEVKLLEKNQELEALKTKKSSLERQLGGLESEKQIEAIDQQCSLLQSLIEENNNISSEQTHDHEALKKSLNILSEKKQNISQKIDNNDKKKIARNLFQDSTDTPEAVSNRKSESVVPTASTAAMGSFARKGRLSLSKRNSRKGALSGSVIIPNQQEKEQLTNANTTYQVKAAPTPALISPLSSSNLFDQEVFDLQTPPLGFAEQPGAKEGLAATKSSLQAEHHESSQDEQNTNGMEEDDEFEKLLKDLNQDKRRIFGTKSGYKILDSFWEDFEPICGPVPFGFSGTAVFEIGLASKQKITEIEEIQDGRPWRKKVIVKKTFENCQDHTRFYQDCEGYFRCPSESCSAKELFGCASQNYTRSADKVGNKTIRKCTSCETEMEHVKCVDKSIQDSRGESPPCRRILDFDYCHDKLTVKYAGEHACVVGPRIQPMDIEYVRTYFKNHPSSTPAGFKDYVIAEAINKKENVDEVALQYADINKIRNIQAAQRKENDPDGSGLNYLERLAVSLGSSNNIKDDYLLEVSRNPVMLIVSSEESMQMSRILSNPQFDNSESVSVDFCESQLKDYSVMAITTYSRDLRQLVPLHQIVFPKPGESADNVELALRKVDERMQAKFGIDFNPKQWTSDSSGAIENGIIRVRGESVKAVLGSDKLHDENNLKRVLKTIPTEQQDSFKKEVKTMVNGLSSVVSENIYKCLLDKAKDSGFDKLHRSLLFNHRKRHKYWKCYREVEDNNATTEQVNRLQTRHSKGASLMDGVSRMVRTAIADKAKFKLARAGVNVNKGPTAKTRESRVENAGNKVMIQVVDSLEEMVSINANELADNVDKDAILKSEALADFKSKNSDTHRSDKLRKSKRGCVKKTRIFNRVALVKAKMKLKEEKLLIVHKDESEDDITVTVKNSLGIENFVNFSPLGITCTCPDHSSSLYCVDILYLLEMMKIKDLTIVKNFKVEDFEDVKKLLGGVKVVNNKEVETLNWEIDRTRKGFKCVSCNVQVKSKELVSKIQRQKFCTTRLCIPKQYRKYPAKLVVIVTAVESSLLDKNGIKTN